MVRTFADQLPRSKYREVQALPTGFIPYVNRDEKGRIVRAYGTITGGRNVKGTEVDPKLSKALRKDSSSPDQAGHIIAKCMGGSGKHSDNLFCQNRSINSSDRDFEETRAQILQNPNNSIIFEYFFVFTDDTFKPTHFYTSFDTYIDNQFQNMLREGDENFCSHLSKKYWQFV